MVSVVVSDSQQAQRLDTLIVQLMPRLSRAFIQKLCGQGKITVNGVVTKPGYKVKLNDTITVAYDERELDAIPDIELPILYEDDDCIVIDKPAGVLTHAPGALTVEATVASFLRSHLTAAPDWQNETNRAGVVHRLDRATSGVLIGAKTQEALSFLQKQFAVRKVKKMYLAIVEGSLKQPEALIDMPIERNPQAPATFRVGPNGKPSTTYYKVVSEQGRYSLLELRPQTGRTHQLRVHLAYIGHPIVGDPLYGHGKYGDRLYLHAASLEITLPNHERKVFIAPQPVEFEELLSHA